jgi:hypothetical protein
MVGGALGRSHAEELLERAAVSTSAGDAPLGVDPFEVAHQEHADVDPGGIEGRPTSSA